MTKYIWQYPNWQEFSWDEKKLLPLVAQARLKQGKLIRKMQNLMKADFKKAEAIIFEQETLKTAQIEGERYNPESVRSSIHRRLGLDYAGLPRTERHIDGLVAVLFDATLKHDQPLTGDRLFSWQAALFPTGFSGLTKIETGKYRADAQGPMQVVSGPIGKEKVHFQAPPASRVPEEMAAYFNWWRESQAAVDGILRAGIAHFYFVTLHPFADGNGRLARVLTDMALAQDDQLARRYYSLSSEIVKRRKQYYEVLEAAQKGGRSITDWLVWFIACFSDALDSAETLLKDVFLKTEFWRRFRSVAINSRQKKVLNRLLDAGRDKFMGGLTTRKYIGIAGASRRTAIREIQNLLSSGMLRQNKGKGRSVSYDIEWVDL